MTEHNVTKTFDVFYTHPDGGLRLIKTVSLTANGEMNIGHWLEELFWRMQGENWSPHGEARELIMEKGVQHTSMSVGDVAREAKTGEVWKVDNFGWKKIISKAPCEA